MHPHSPNWNLKGLKADPQRSIKITFHAIVPKPLWEWDETSCMHIRFGHKDLGDWKHNVGDFREIRYNVLIHKYQHTYYITYHISPRQEDDGFCEMTCTLSIEAELLKELMEYKYVIFSPKMNKRDDGYEYLHSFAEHWDTNRCLHIDKAIGGSC